MFVRGGVLKKNDFYKSELIIYKNHGKFYQLKNIDAYIMNIIFNYKVINNKCGFPDTAFDKINTNEVSLSTLEAEYKEIISLKEQGLNYREIGLKFGVSHTTIQRKIKSFEKLKNAETIIKDKN